MIQSLLRIGFLVLLFPVLAANAETMTWDGKHDTTNINVSIVYFLPADRPALPDWRDRVDYYARRITQFHTREFNGQSSLQTVVHPNPVVSKQTTSELRQGDADKIFFRTLSQVDRQLAFAKDPTDAFPILLVLSEINWRPLDDFYRLHPRKRELVFEGNYNQGEHFPGAASGGARATYLADRGVGWGLVSADGWRVPYRGSDCVIYHEGCGHTVGLPHPEPGNGSVMSMGQYKGWISESWLDKEQKSRLRWEPKETPNADQIELFSRFRALPKPSVPRPGQVVKLKLDWPDEAQVKSLRVRFQTSIAGSWVDVPQSSQQDPPEFATLGAFDRPTPVSYRVDAELENGATAELWGYFQVRVDRETVPQPFTLSPDLITAPSPSDNRSLATLPTKEVNLLDLADPENGWTVGQWSKNDGKLQSPKRFGARLELPYRPPTEYRLTMIIEPLDQPNGLILGQRSGSQRFVTLFNYANGPNAQSAIENIDGRNVGNETTFDGQVFQTNRLSQVIVTVLESRVRMEVDGHVVADWIGDSSRLSLSDYWKTPGDELLFLGAYDCRYRFHRITLAAITGQGEIVEPSED
jgi:hypothetical protein